MDYMLVKSILFYSEPLIVFNTMFGCWGKKRKRKREKKKKKSFGVFEYRKESEIGKKKNIEYSFVGFLRMYSLKKINVKKTFDLRGIY